MAHIEHLKELVKNLRFPKAFGLGGGEALLIDDALAQLRLLQKKDDPAGLNHHRYTLEEVHVSLAIHTLQTPPFAATYRLVEVQSAEKLDAHDLESLLAYIDNPAPDAILVLIFAKVDKRNKLWQALSERQLFFSAEISAKDIGTFIRAEAQKVGLKLNAELEAFLAMSFDNDLLAIKSTLKKLALTKEAQSLSLEEALLQVSGTGMQDVFKLARSISEGELGAALKTLALVRHQENALKLLGVLTWQFRVLLHIRHCLDAGMADWDIRKEVSVYGDRFSWMLRVAKKRTIAFHINRLTRLLQCDLALKSQKTAEPFNMIERVVYQSVL